MFCTYDILLPTVPLESKPLGGAPLSLPEEVQTLFHQLALPSLEWRANSSSCPQPIQFNSIADRELGFGCSLCQSQTLRPHMLPLGSFNSFHQWRPILQLPCPPPPSTSSSSSSSSSCILRLRLRLSAVLWAVAVAIAAVLAMPSTIRCRCCCCCCNHTAVTWNPKTSRYRPSIKI